MFSFIALFCALISICSRADTPAVIQWSAPNYYVPENAGKAALTITRSGNTAVTASVAFATADGTANALVDYLAQSGRVTFAAGETSKAVQIAVLDDPFVEGDETVRLVLSDPSPGAVLGGSTNATLTIQDNERPVGLLDDFNPQVPENISFVTAAPQLDGRLILLGMDCNSVPGCSGRVSRLLADGSPDPEFMTVTNITAGVNIGLSLSALAVQPDGKVLIGGNFTNVATSPTRFMARFNPDGSPDTAFNTNVTIVIASGGVGVQTIALQPDGKIVLGGAFGRVNGAAHLNLARLNQDGSLDTNFVGRADQPVNNISVLADGRLLVRGYFASLGKARPGLGILNADGTVDDTFRPRLTSSGSVNAAAVLPDGEVLIAGYNSLVVGVLRRAMALLHADGTVNTNFNVGDPRDGSHGPASIQSMAVLADGRILVSGSFTNIGGIARSSIARLLPNGDGDPTFALQMEGSAQSMVVGAEDSVLLVNGFYSINGYARPALARLNGDPSRVHRLQFSSLHFAVAGGKEAVITVERLGETSGALAVDYSTHDGTALAGEQYLAQAGTLQFAPLETTKSFVVPTFADLIADSPKTVSLRLSHPVPDANLGAPSVAELAIVDNPSAPHVLADSLVVAENAGYASVTLERSGDLSAPLQFKYSTSDGTARSGQAYGAVQGTVSFATNQSLVTIQIPVVDNGQVDGPRTFKLDLTGSDPFRGVSTALVTIVDNELPPLLDPSFHASILPPYLQLALLQPDGKLIIVGGFTNVGGLIRNGIARLNPNGAVDASFDPGDGVLGIPNGGPLVSAMALQPDGKILLTGDFYAVGGGDHLGIARLNADGSVDTAFTASIVPQQNGPGHGLLIRPDGKILVFGNVSIANGVLQNDVVQLNADGSLDDSFRAPIQLGYNWPAPPAALHPDGKVLLVGNSIVSANIGLGPLVRLNTNGTLDKSFTFTQRNGAETMNYLTALALLSDGKFLASGYINYDRADVNGNFGRNGIMRYNGNGSVDPTFSSPIDASLNQILVRPDGTILLSNGAVLDPDGAVEQTVNIGGTVVALQPDDRAIALGTAESGLVRFFVDGNHPGGPEFAGSSVFPLESDGSVTLLVQRLGDSTLPFTVDFATVDGGARAGVDYVAQSGTLHFAALQMTNAITIPLRNNAQVDGDRTFDVVLSHPTGNAVLQYHDRVTVTIVNNDSGIQFATDTFFVNESDGAAQILVTRRGEQLGVAAVDLFTTGGTATVGADYLPVHTTLVFAAGETQKTALIPILDDGVVERTETVRLALANARGGTVLGPTTNAVLTIMDNEIAPAVDVSFDAGTAANAILALGVQSDGKVIAGGNFSQFNGQNVVSLVRLNKDGSLDSTFAPAFSTNTSFSLSGILVQPDNKIVFWGNGTPFGNASGLLRLNADGTRDVVFKVSLSQSARGTYVSAVALQPDGKIMFGGAIDRVNGVLRTNLCRLNTDGTVDATFQAGPSRRMNNQEQGVVNGILLQSDGKVIIAGSIGLVGGHPVEGLVRLNADGSFDSSFARVNAYQIFAAQPADRLLVQGPAGAVRLNRDGTVDSGFHLAPGVSIYGPALLQPDGKLLCTGNFIDGTVSRIGVLRLNADGSLDNGLPVFSFTSSSYSGGPVTPTALAVQPDGKIVAAGDFAIVNGQPRGKIVRLFSDLAGPPGFQFGATSFGAGEGDGIAVVTVQRLGDTTKPASVDFSTHTGALPGGVDESSDSLTLNFDAFEVEKTVTVPIFNDPLPGDDQTQRLALDHPSAGLTFGAAVNASALFISDGQRPGSVESAFNPLIETTNSNYSSLQLVLQPDGKAIVAGNFQRVNGIARSGLCRLNSDGSVDPSFDPIGGLPFADYADVFALALQPDGKLLVRGSFPSFSGTALPNFVRLNPDGSLDTAFLPDPRAVSPVYSGGSAMAVQADGKILLSENTSLARLDITGAADPTMDIIPVVGVRGWFSTFNVILVEQDGRTLFEGDIDTGDVYNGGPRRGLTRLNADGSVDETFQPLMDVLGLNAAVVQLDGKIVICGNFSQIDGVDQTRLARLNADGSLDRTFIPPTDLANNTSLIAAQPDGRILVYYSDATLSTIYRLNSDGSRDFSFDVGRDGFKQVAGTGAVSAMVPLPDGQLLVAGTFTSVNGVARYDLVKLNGDQNAIAAPPRFRSIARRSPTQTLLSLDVMPGRSISLETSTNLTSWAPLTNYSSTNYVLGLTNIETAPSSRRFYRASQAPR